MAADFNKPTVSGEYTTIPGQIRDNFAAAITVHESDSSSNKPVGTKSISATGVIQRWNGAAWVTLADPAAHAASTSNPHSVTAAQVGAPVISHTHDGTGSNGPKLGQSTTHESADTDVNSSSLHHTLGSGANQAAAGNHTHSYVPLSAQTRGSSSTTTNNSAFTIVALPTGWTNAHGTFTYTVKYSTGYGGNAVDITGHGGFHAHPATTNQGFALHHGLFGKGSGPTYAFGNSGSTADATSLEVTVDHGDEDVKITVSVSGGNLQIKINATTDSWSGLQVFLGAEAVVT